MLREVLADEGWDVQVASTAEEARRVVQSTRPELVVMDVILPGGGGDDLLSEMASETARPAIIVITGLPTAITPEMRQAADAVLVKPFGLEEFVGAVAKATGREEGGAGQ